MRRIFAFITLALSLLVVVAVGAPTIKETMSKGTDFDGGYNILYHVTTVDDVEYQGSTRDSVMAKATKYVNDRLNTLNITNPEVAVANDNYLSITIQDLSDEQLDTVRYALANNSAVTIRDTNDSLLGNGEDVFSDLSLVSNGSNIVLNCKVKDADKLEEITSHCAESYSEDESGNASPNLIIWCGFESNYTSDVADELGFDGDSYRDIGSNDYARFKILTAIAVSSALTADFSCTANVEEVNVSLMNKILSQDKVMYVLSEESTLKVGSFYKSTIPTLSLIAGIIGIVVICALFVINYKFAGITSALSLVLYGVITLLAYNLFGGLFGLETLIALMIGLVLSVDANVVFLERIRTELKKGKDVERAYDEGSKKSASAVLDSNVLVLIASLALYLFGTQVIKSFAAVLIISEVVIILVVVFLTRIMLSLICHSKANKSPKWFGVKDDQIGTNGEVKENAKIAKIKFTANPKLKTIIGSGIVAAGLVFGLLFQLIGGNAFNYHENLRNGSRFYFSSLDSKFATEEKVENWFSQETGFTPTKITIGTDTITISRNDALNYIEKFEEYGIANKEGSTNKYTVYNVSVYYNKTLGQNVIDGVDEYFEKEASIFYDKDNNIEVFDMNYCSGSYEPYSGKKAILTGAIVLGAALAFMIVYLWIRFSFSYALTSALSVIQGEAILYSLIAITRLKIGVEAIALGLALAVIIINANSITFDRLQENISENSDVVWKESTRLEFAQKALKETTFGHFLALTSALLVGVLTFAFNLGSVSTGLIFALVGVVSVYVSLFVMPHIWAKLDGVFAAANAKARERKAKRKKKIPTDEVQEFTFFGIND